MLISVWALICLVISVVLESIEEVYAEVKSTFTSVGVEFSCVNMIKLIVGAVFVYISVLAIAFALM